MYNVLQAWWADRLDTALLTQRVRHTSTSVMNHRVVKGDPDLQARINSTDVSSASQSADDVCESETAVSLHLLAWQCTFLLLIYVFIFPFFDFIPWFGQAASWTEFSDRVCTYLRVVPCAMRV